MVTALSSPEPDTAEAKHEVEVGAPRDHHERDRRRDGPRPRRHRPHARLRLARGTLGAWVGGTLDADEMADDLATAATSSSAALTA